MKFLSTLVTNKYVGSITLSMKKVIVPASFAIAIILILSVPTKTVKAGLFSFISDVGGEQVSAKNVDSSSKLNSQNMVLLEAAVNLDPNPYKDVDEGLIAYGNALSPEVGPQGTPSEVENRVTGNISIYTVREGDTISGIADMFDISVNTVLWANELSKNSRLKEGQVLVILPISGIKHTVKRGDTIKSIANRYKIDVEEIVKDNDITPVTKLAIGQVIVIPNAETAYVAPKTVATKKDKATSPAHDTGGPFYPGYFIKPISVGIKSQGLHGYNAVDLAAPIGTPIRAAASGKVITSISNGKWNGGYGNFIIIAHDNGTQTLYSHNQKNFVEVGDRVEQGTMIAKIGMTGQTTGPHVHFEIRGAKNPF